MHFFRVSRRHVCFDRDDLRISASTKTIISEGDGKGLGLVYVKVYSLETGGHNLKKCRLFELTKTALVYER